MMTRKHFQAIAKIFASHRSLERAIAVRKGNCDDRLGVERSLGRSDAIADLTHAFAEFCADSNPNFDREKFLKACGVDND